MFWIAITRLFLNSSLLECSPPTKEAQVRFPARTCQSQVNLVVKSLKSLHSGDPDKICLTWQWICRLACAWCQYSGLTCKCFSAYTLVQFMCVHICSWNTCTGGRVSDLHWFNADPDTDPDPAFFLIVDPDPGSGSRVWWPKIEKNV
jgi:hypothetical protein